MAVASQFLSGVWSVVGMAAVDTPEIVLPASGQPVGKQAIDIDNRRIWEVSFDGSTQLHVWQLMSSLSGYGQTTIDFGPTQSQRASVAVSAPLILPSATVSAGLAYGPTPDHSEDEHQMASTAVGIVAGSVVPGVGFTIRATTQANMSGAFAVIYSWKNP